MQEKTAAPKNRSIPALEGWVSIPVAGQMLDRTRQRLFQMGEEGKLKTIRQIQGSDPAGRPVGYVIREAEIQDLIAAEQAATECPQCAELKASGIKVEFCEHRGDKTAADYGVSDAALVGA